ncbi:hypothetical protein L218DRAFT_651987 [Marasmius fiardii PR-910]|nr:hypothetical protein L218DRAFT_651987 [Marasmius fiardii PR-910]
MTQLITPVLSFRCVLGLYIEFRLPSEYESLRSLSARQQQHLYRGSTTVPIVVYTYRRHSTVLDLYPDNLRTTSICFITTATATTELTGTLLHKCDFFWPKCALLHSSLPGLQCLSSQRRRPKLRCLRQRSPTVDFFLSAFQLNCSDHVYDQ